MRIAVIDGHGGGMGKMIIEEIKKNIDKNKDTEILALGTNSIATSAMKKAGADIAATGENPVIYNSKRVDIIVGPIAIIMPNGLTGEITPKMAEAVASSDAQKFLIPSNKCNVEVIFSSRDNLSDIVKLLVKRIFELVG